MFAGYFRNYIFLGNNVDSYLSLHYVDSSCRHKNFVSIMEFYMHIIGHMGFKSKIELQFLVSVE